MPVVALVLAATGVGVLLPNADPAPVAKAVEVQPAKPLPTRTPRPATPPPAAEPERELPRLAAGWSAAIRQNNDPAILQGALELRIAPDGRDQLLTLTDDPHARTRAYALRELGSRKEHELEPVFRTALADSDPHVRHNAEWALEQLK